MERTVTRRRLLQTAFVGIAGVAVTHSPMVRALPLPALTSVATWPLGVTMRECEVEAVDLTRVYSWAFDVAGSGPRVPGAVVSVQEGDGVVLEITNELPGVHAFAITGVVDSGPIEPGQTVRVEFDAPRAGTYVYHDPLRLPLNRAMGLAGVLVVHGVDSNTPYSSPTSPVQSLFDDLGHSYSFPGDPWSPERSWTWVFSCLDPVANALVATAPDLDPEEYLDRFLPRYFTLNGRSGFFAAHDPSAMIRGRIGQPALVRVANVGLATHAPHVHGNHVYLLAEDAHVRDNVVALDVWRVAPLQTTDVLLPFVRPPDAHPWPPSDPRIFERDLAGDGTRGLVYPMHCHMELSQLANGGNYPHGLLTHWVIEGDLAPTSSTTTSGSTTSTEPAGSTSSTGSTTTTSSPPTSSTGSTTTTSSPPTSSTSSSTVPSSTSSSTVPSSTSSSTVPSSASSSTVPSSTSSSTVPSSTTLPSLPAAPRPGGPRRTTWARVVKAILRALRRR